MAALDIIIAVVVIVAAVGGFMRGLVQEVLSLASWIMAAMAIHFMHPALTEGLRNFYPADPAVSLLGFVLLLLVPYAAIKIIVGNVSGASDGAVLGPIDRVLGFGFGAIKGALISIFAFALLVTGNDESWGYDGRPQWMTGARTYAAAEAFSRQLLPEIGLRRDRLRSEAKARAVRAARFRK